VRKVRDGSFLNLKTEEIFMGDPKIGPVGQVYTDAEMKAMDTALAAFAKRGNDVGVIDRTARKIIASAPTGDDEATARAQAARISAGRVGKTAAPSVRSITASVQVTDKGEVVVTNLQVEPRGAALSKADMEKYRGDIANQNAGKKPGHYSCSIYPNGI
jgi:hypothetical protein